MLYYRIIYKYSGIGHLLMITGSMNAKGFRYEKTAQIMERLSLGNHKFGFMVEARKLRNKY